MADRRFQGADTLHVCHWYGDDVPAREVVDVRLRVSRRAGAASLHQWHELVT